MSDPRRIQWVIDNLSQCDNLTEWEPSFVDSVSAQFEAKGTLSQKQVDTLEKIYQERDQ